MKFTSNWRIILGYNPDGRDDINAMPCGNSFLEAADAALDQKIVKQRLVEP